MKSIILKPHELANIDRLSVVVRPFQKQPSDEWTPFLYGEVHKMVDGEFVQPLKIMGWGPCNESGNEAYISPFFPGETVFVKETFSMPKWASRFTIKFNTVEAKQVDGVWCWLFTVEVEKV